MEKKYNTKSPAVKRLMREAAEMATATSDYYATPLEDNLFEWHFTVRGPEATDFEGGVYHGRILVPPEYPMKPPDIIVLTPNGRFTVGKKICLSISGFHPETWQPSWSIRTALLAIIGFMPTPGHGTIGALDYTPQERKILAQRSVHFSCDECGVTAQLLAPVSQESSSPPGQDQELRDIIQSMALKSEEEILEEKKHMESVSSPTDSQQTAVEPAAVASAAAAPPDPSGPQSSSSRASQNNLPAPASPAYRIQEDGGNSRAFQFYDVLIMIVVAMIGILIFRRVAINEIEDVETSEGHLHNDGV